MMDERVKRGPGRPRKEQSEVVTNRPRRKRADGEGPLYIANPDPNFYYFWPVDTSENGAKIARYLANNYEFVTTDDNLQIGSGFVHEVRNVGSCYRVPAGQNDSRYHYLMKIRREWYEEDEKADQDFITQREKAITKVDTSDGQYRPDQEYTGFER